MFIPHFQNQRTAAYLIGAATFFAFGLSANAQSPRGRERSTEVKTQPPGSVKDLGASEGGATDPVAAGTPAQLLERGKAALEEIGAARSSLTGLVAAAKDKRDVVKVLCLDDKSGQVDAAWRTTEERVDSLAIAAKHGADARAQHEYLMVVTLKERVGVLMGEANQCLGEEAGFTGDAVVNVEIEANLPRVIAEVVPFSPVLFVPVSLNSGVY